MRLVLLLAATLCLRGQIYIADFDGYSEQYTTTVKINRHSINLPGWCCASTLGEQRTLVMTNQTDYAMIYAAMFGQGPESLNSFYRENSNGQIWFSGDVVTGIVIADGSLYGSCSNLLRISDEYDAIAASRGYVLDNYTRRVYGFPINCAWGGFSTLGAYGSGKPWLPQYSRAWVRGLPGPIHHEMGHSLGLAHANRPGVEYGDPTDRMGGAPRRFNAPHQLQMAWMTAQDVTTDGQFLVAPLEAASGTRILRLPKPSTGEFYYLSYRQEAGYYDSGWYAPLLSGLHVHTHDGAGEGTVTQFIDATPWTSDWFDSPLTDGGRFVGEGFYVDQLSHDTSGVLIRVTFGSAPPPPPPPPPPPSPCRPRGKSGQCK